MSWYKRGQEAITALERQEKVSKLLKEKSVPWFWLKPGEEAVVVLVDDDPFWCEVHTVQIGNRWVNLTCSEGLRPCRICQVKGRRPAGVTFYTAIDLRPFTTQDGRVLKARKVLLPAKSTLAKQLIELKEKHKSLVGLKIRLKRYTNKDPNTGIVVEVLGRVRLKGEFAVPFEYEKVLAPPTDEELEALGFVVPVEGDSILEEEDLDAVLEEDDEEPGEDEALIEGEPEPLDEEEDEEEEEPEEEAPKPRKRGRPPKKKKEEEEPQVEEEKPKKRGRPKKKKEEEEAVEEKPKKRGRPKKKKEEVVEEEADALLAEEGEDIEGLDALMADIEALEEDDE